MTATGIKMPGIGCPAPPAVTIRLVAGAMTLADSDAGSESPGSLSPAASWRALSESGSLSSFIRIPACQPSRTPFLHLLQVLCAFFPTLHSIKPLAGEESDSHPAAAPCQSHARATGSESNNAIGPTA